MKKLLTTLALLATIVAATAADITFGWTNASSQVPDWAGCKFYSWTSSATNIATLGKTNSFRLSSVPAGNWSFNVTAVTSNAVESLPSNTLNVGVPFPGNGLTLFASAPGGILTFRWNNAATQVTDWSGWKFYYQLVGSTNVTEVTLAKTNQHTLTVPSGYYGFSVRALTSLGLVSDPTATLQVGVPFSPSAVQVTGTSP